MAASQTREQLLQIAGPGLAADASVLAPLIDTIRARHGNAVIAVIYYGSCLRSGNPYDGLNDFYVIVDSYRRAHRGPLSALFNFLLPPNVYYLERTDDQGTLRLKYAVLSIAQLERGASRWFQSAIWGRFAQPTAIIHARTPEAHDRVLAAFGACVVTLLVRALPMLPTLIAPDQAFARALALSYGSELRVEGKSRTSDLVSGNEEEYRRRFLAALPLLPYAVNIENNGSVSCRIPTLHRYRGRLSWPLRRMQGKFLSLLRLIKASFTFSGAIDYGVWKLKRHTGVDIVVTPRLRRYPLIFIWPLLWRLYRTGALR